MKKLGLVSQGKVFSMGLEQLVDDDDLVSVYRKTPQPLPIKVRDMHMPWVL